MVQSCSPGTPPNQVRPFQPHCSAARPSLGDQNALWSPHSSCPVPALGLGRTGCNHTGGGQGVTPGALTQASCPSTDSPPPLSRWPNPNGSAHCGDLTVCAGLSGDPLGILAESLRDRDAELGSGPATTACSLHTRTHWRELVWGQSQMATVVPTAGWTLQGGTGGPAQS